MISSVFFDFIEFYGVFEPFFDDFRWFLLILNRFSVILIGFYKIFSRF